MGILDWDKKLFKLEQTWHGVSPVYDDCRTEIIFPIACLGKKLGFHTEICKCCE